MSIERLSALARDAKAMLDMAVDCISNGRRDEALLHAEKAQNTLGKLLIAELGQEVGAVADGVIVSKIGDYFAVEQEMACVMHDDKKIAECYTNEDAEFVGAAIRAYTVRPKAPTLGEGWDGLECQETLAQTYAGLDALTSPAHTAEARDALMAARETEDDGAAIMGRLARALAKADPSSKLPRMAIDWLRSKGIHWKSHCPTDPLHDIGAPEVASPAHTSEARDAARLVAAARRLDKFSLVILSSVAVEDPEFSERVGAALVDLRNAAHADPCAVKYRKALERIFDCGRFPEGHHSAGDHEFCGSHHADCIAIAREALSEDAAMRQEGGNV